MVVHRRNRCEVSCDPESLVERVGLSASALRGCICSDLGTCTCVLRSLVCSTRVGEGIADELGYDVDILGGGVGEGS